MVGTFSKVRNLISATNRFERMQSLLEIRLNRLLCAPKVARPDTRTFSEFLQEIALTDSGLVALAGDIKEAEGAVQMVRDHFRKITEEKRLPFALSYNADKSLAVLSYALTRYLKPRVAVETGVGYGITSALVLLAMEQNHVGRLVSIDLPPLSDPHGAFVGIAVPKHLTHLWSLRLGSSRRWLLKTLSEIGELGLFVSDSANVYTLQWYEFQAAWPRIAQVGAAIFNNTGGRFQAALRSVTCARVYVIKQIEKLSCVTSLILRDRPS